MAFITFPTSKDIYIEIDGRRLATAQSYKAKTTRESRYVEAFGSAEPVGTVGGRVRHVLELTRAAVNYPAKMDVPLVWDLYMDTARPVGQTQETASITAANGQSTPAAPLEAVRQADYTPQPIAYTPEQMPAAPERSGYYEAADDDTQMLSLVNDRLRAQARRYPHPITNEMEAIH